MLNSTNKKPLQYLPKNELQPNSNRTKCKW